MTTENKEVEPSAMLEMFVVCMVGEMEPLAIFKDPRDAKRWGKEKDPVKFICFPCKIPLFNF